MTLPRSHLVLRAVPAAGLIVAIVVGVPALLLAIGAGPVPPVLHSWDAVTTAVTTPDDGTLLLALMRILAWICWVVLTVLILAEGLSQARGTRMPRLPALSIPQDVARGLTAAVLAAFFALPGQATANAVPPRVAVAASEPASPPLPTNVSAAVAEGSPTSPPPTPASTGEAAVTPSPAGSEGEGGRFVVHTVRANDSLWRLAETHLGDGARFGEIADANYGRPQPDGFTLTKAHWIHPGWRLLIPDESAQSHVAAQAPSASDVQRRVVRPGESLWGIAESELGDGNLWPQIREASRDVVQPDGARLTDPDLVRTGWTVVLPPTSSPDAPAAGDAAPSEPATPEAAPRPAAEPTAEPSPKPTVEPAREPVPSAEPGSGDSSSVEAPDAADDPDLDLDETSPWVARTSGGVGSLLAAGLIGVLATRRRLRALRRRPGTPHAPLPSELAAVDRELRAAADPAGTDIVNQALRSLAAACAAGGTPLPALRVVRLTHTEIELYLEDPAHLPAPWTAPEESPGGLVWRMQTDQAPMLTDSELADIPAPYPALVTLGHDHEDAHFLIDLERLGVLDLLGAGETSRAVISAMAVELATSTWADDVQVTLVGDFATLEDALASGRLRYVPALGDALDELAARNAADARELAAVGADLATARSRGLTPGVWTPEVLLVNTPMTTQQRERLVELLEERPRTAWAGITVQSGVGRWSLHLDDLGSAVLEPVGLTLRPQLLDDETRARVQHLVALADPDNAAPPRDGGSDEGVHDVEPLLPDLAGLRAQDIDAAPLHAGPGVDSPQRHPLTLPGSSSSAAEPLDPAAAPIVRVLGPVQVDGARGRVEPSKRARLAELVAFLALNPGVHARQVDEAIWPARRHEDNLNTRNTATSKARAWLGRNEANEDFLPRHSAGAGYGLVPAVRTDWSWWLELVGTTAATAPTEDLESALALVRGRPFDGVHPRRYAWADALRQQMAEQIVDVAYEVARRRLLAGRWQATEAATAVGLMVEPAWEPLWRLRIMAAHEARNRPAVREAVARMLALTEAVGGDLDPATHRLLADVEAAAGERAAAW